MVEDMELMQLRLVFVFVLTRQEQDKTACVAGQAWRRSTSITGPADKKAEQRHLKGPAPARRALVASYLVKPGSESQVQKVSESHFKSLLKVASARPEQPDGAGRSKNPTEFKQQKYS